MPYARLCQKFPIKFLAWVNFAHGCDIRMSQYALRSNAMLRNNGLAELNHGYHLLLGKIRHTIVVATIDDFNANGC